MKYDVFISYSSHDQKVVEGLCAYLERQKIRCFTAYRDILHGQKWAAAIVEALEESRMMVVVFSKHFNNSDQVDREIELASENKKPILTYRITDDAFKGAKKYYLKNINWIDAFPEPEKKFGVLAYNIAKLLDIKISAENSPSIEEYAAPNKKNLVKPMSYFKFSARLLIGLLISIAIVAVILIDPLSDDRIINSETAQALKLVKNGGFGYIDETGNEIIPFIYDDARDFSEGLAWVKSADKWGCIDETGKAVIPFIYDYAYRFSEGLASVKMNDKYGYVDRTGKVVIPFEDHLAWPFTEGLAGVCKDGRKFGFINKGGEIVIPIVYNRVMPFTEGLALVINDLDYCGFINKSGEIVIPFNFQPSANEFSEGLFPAGKGDTKRGYIDKTGEVVIPFVFDRANSFSEGLALVEENGKYGFIDKNGIKVIPLKYDQAYDGFSDGLAGVEKDGKWGFIDKNDKLVIPFIYDFVCSFSDGLAQVYKDDEMFYINKKGEKVY